MGRGSRQPDTIGLELDRMLEAGIRKKKFELFEELKTSFHFTKLTSLAHGANHSANDRLAHAILDARWNNMPVGPVVEKYAQTYIYPHRKKN
ncbi:MAG: hypothetical protein A2494_04020 [Candidatus Lloydbacteria bacterium RIFOXYC12_FULL_46_25]|uniref:Uncharacterized protein n=1 Tax=Candidatus Lloydbacteria bacterium RIFOXYC12_FULL_46_25 TaxID=1798670 RepID=A0A1G2DUE7_9BACT|nr:MAG: hypothetical protein A2494_04020 [Candidatus Lloydbacteria bacterium RIFOXYC12_FULL_46_25]